MEVQDPGGDALGGENVGGLQGHLDHHAHGHDGHVLAVAQGDALAQLEVIAGDGVGDGLYSGAAQAHIGGALVLEQGLDGQGHLVGVAGAQNGHAGDGAHEGEVLDALVGGAVLAHGQAAVGAHDLDIHAGVGDGVAHLLPGAAGGEHGEGVGKGLEAAGGQAGGHALHVALGDAHVEEALGIGGFKALGHGGSGQVGLQHDQLGITVSQGDQGVAVGITGGFLFRHVSSPPIP